MSGDYSLRRGIRRMGKVYIVEFDAYGVLDTITREDGERMTSTSTVGRFVNRNASKIYNGDFISGLEYVRAN